jgi:hypothetical protein
MMFVGVSLSIDGIYPLWYRTEIRAVQVSAAGPAHCRAR